MSGAEINAAVRNNADWVAAVCRAHGIGYTYGPRSWRSAGPTPRFYPEAITLRPTATPSDVLPAGSVKDSFATLDLTPYGFTELFAAEWIHRPAGPGPAPALESLRVASDAELLSWQAACGTDVFPPAILDDAAVQIMAVRDEARMRGGFILNRTGAVLGLSNLFALDPDDLPLIWSAAAAAGGDRPMVGYESGDDLVRARPAGFRPIGPLRIWARQDSVDHELGDGQA